MIRRQLLLGVFSSALVLVSACSSDSTHDCNDGRDNDGDGLIDEQDPGCAFNGDLEAPDPVLAACEDRIDNDGDGLIDLDDPGCDSRTDDDESNDPVPACRDGIDNDGDGLIDFPNDPGCAISLQDSEDDDCPDGPTCPACANGIDDDGDGAIDYPDDLGCNGAADNDESSPPPPVCDGGLTPLAIGGDATGTLTALMPNNLISQGCGGTGPELGYSITVAAPSALLITSDFEETTVDTVIYLQSVCGDSETELGCNDDQGTEPSSRLFLSRVEAGTYVLIVDSHGGGAGDFKVSVTAFVPEGEACDSAAPNCAPNLECRVAGAGGGETCEVPINGPSCDDAGTLRAKVVPQAGDLVISEYMANPSAVSDPVGEWFEVKANANVDIGGLQMGRAETTGPGSVLVTLDPTACLPVATGTHLLFASNADSAVNGGLPAVDHVIGFGIVNTDDGLFIGMDGAILDIVTYASTVDGASTSLDPSGAPFCTASSSYGAGDRGTPGAVNDTCP